MALLAWARAMLPASPSTDRRALMNYGTFPSLPGPSLPGSALSDSNVRSYRAGVWPTGRLEVGTVHAERRAFIMGLGGLLVGSLGGALLTGWGSGGAASGGAASGGAASGGEASGGVASGGGAPAETLASDANKREGLPAWANEMRSMDDETLLLMAGEFERRSARHRQDREAAPGFERLLSVALSSRRREADMAASCAIRSLHRLGRTDLVAIWADDVRRRSQLLDANRELEDILDRALRKRRRLIPR